MSQHASLITTLYQIGAVQFGEFQLKSGQTSSVYLNLRKIISYPGFLRQIADAMWAKVHDRAMNVVCGVPYTALPIATCLSLDQNIPMIMRRKEKKDYGTKQSIEGVFQPGDRCLVIEDVITTGGSIIETANDLTAAGLVVSDVIALIDREQGGRANLEQHYQTYTVLTITEILEYLLTSTVLKPNEKPLIEKFLLEKASK